MYGLEGRENQTVCPEIRGISYSKMNLSTWQQPVLCGGKLVLQWTDLFSLVSRLPRFLKTVSSLLSVFQQEESAKSKSKCHMLLVGYFED